MRWYLLGTCCTSLPKRVKSHYVRGKDRKYYDAMDMTPWT